MPEQKINRTELYQMLKEGKTGVECAEYFGVQPSSISMARKELNLSVVKNVGLERAHEVLGQELDALSQLNKINVRANEMLDELTGSDKTVKKLAVAVKGYLDNKGDSEKQRELIKSIARRLIKDKEVGLKAMREIRGQLSLQLEIFKTLYDMESVAAFQRAVLTSIQEVAPDVKDKIIEKLKQDKALRGSVKLVT